jgi:ElaB/YqjD/DUF883 family membrane-anchored ribosome-binding protein
MIHALPGNQSWLFSTSSTFDDLNRLRVRDSLRHLRPRPSVQRPARGAISVATTAADRERTPLETSRQFQQLMNDVEELLARLDDEHSPQLDQLRSRVEATIAQARSAATNQVRSTAAQVRHYAGMADDYITGYPRTAFASGILIGGLLGFLVASTRSGE